MGHPVTKRTLSEHASGAKVCTKKATKTPHKCSKRLHCGPPNNLRTRDSCCRKTLQASGWRAAQVLLQVLSWRFWNCFQICYMTNSGRAHFISTAFQMGNTWTTCRLLDGFPDWRQHDPLWVVLSHVCLNSGVHCSTDCEQWHILTLLPASLLTDTALQTATSSGYDSWERKGAATAATTDMNHREQNTM